jgi:glyoxylate/hydroxypyruvate reductase A
MEIELATAPTSSACAGISDGLDGDATASRHVRLSMSVVFHSTVDDPDDWLPRLRKLLPDVEICQCSEVADPAKVRVGVFWDQPATGLGAYTSLVAVLSLGAGINQLAPETIPPGVQIARLVDPNLTGAMTEYCLAAVLRFYRNLDVYERERRWNFSAPVQREEFIVGVMGLGVLGSAVAARLAANGFPIRGWSARQKTIAGVHCYAGRETLAAFADGLRRLICLLPLTNETSGILNARLFGRLEGGAAVINVGRGAHLIESDLLAALASGQLRGAMLDVFREEPLPAGHAFWRNNRILITPHVAAISDANSGAAVIAANIRRALGGEPLLNTVDRSRGY